MAYCFYNGVKLPELPSTAYAYCWIRKNDNTQHYDLIFTKVLGYYDAAAGGIVYGANQGTTEIAHYRIPYSSAAVADGWDSYQTTNTWMALDANRTVMWSNHYIPNGSLTATEMYFDAHEAIPEVDEYRIEKETVEDIADQVRRLCKTDATMTPAVIKSNLEGLNIELMETFVISTDKEQVIYPDEGYYGFSKITVGAIDYPGGGESPGGGAAEDETFGDDYGEPTGNYDYTGGTDDNPPYIPEIPGTGYKALFSKKVKMGSYVKFARGKVWNQNYTEMVPDYVELQSNNGNFYVYATWGYSRNTDITWVSIYMYSDTAINYRYRTMLGSGKMGTWSSYTRMGAKDGFSGFWGWSTVNSISAAYTELQDYQIVRGIPFFSLGDFSDSDSYETAARALATSSDEEQGKNQFIAFVSDTQILYDGSVINNMDNSPMTIYECDANGKNTWTQIGTTDGTDYPVGAYTLVWNSHDLLDTTGQYVTHSKSDDPIPEMAPGDVGVPVERNETYTIEGETMNGLVSSAQKVTGGKTPLTPTEAKQALDDYYNHPAEEMLW